MTTRRTFFSAVFGVFAAAVYRTPDLAVPDFEMGTHGQYLDFGQGTLATLHGRYAIGVDEAHQLDRSVLVKFTRGRVTHSQRLTRSAAPIAHHVKQRNPYM